MSSTTLISTRGLTKVYQMGEFEVHALRGIDLDIARGEFIAIMGASGSGKTTYMNLLGCLDRPTAGSYELDGIAVHEMSSNSSPRCATRRSATYFSPLSPSRTTALENVELPCFTPATSAIRKGSIKPWKPWM